MFAVSLCLSACASDPGGDSEGTAGGETKPPTASSRIVNVNVANVTIIEPEGSEERQAIFLVKLDRVAPSSIRIAYTTQDGTAIAGSDYVAQSGEFTIAAGEQEYAIAVTVLAANEAAASEQFSLALNLLEGEAILPPSAPSVTIIKPLPAQRALNDTGAVQCYGVSGVLNCASAPQGQDAHVGRDTEAQLIKTGQGDAGFDFTKLDASGQPLANQATNFASDPWACVKDNHRQLIWEVKTNAAGLHNASRNYHWYSTDTATNGGHAGNQGLGCAQGDPCNTQAYVAAVNQASLCGHNDWRMPTLEELRSLVDYGKSSGSAIDQQHFPYVSDFYWASDTIAYEDVPNLGMQAGSTAGLMYFVNGQSTLGGTKATENRRVMLVREAN